MEEIFVELEMFLKLPLRNKWIRSDVLKIYVRKSKRLLEGQHMDCIDLASMEVIEEENYGKGIFTKFLEEFMKRYSEHNIFVESILTKRFALFFERHGFKRTKESTVHQCNMYLLKRN